MRGNVALNGPLYENPEYSPIHYERKEDIPS